MIGSDPECAEMRMVASIVSNQINKMCDSPLLQSKMAMYVCMYSYTRTLVHVYLYLYTYMYQSRPVSIVSTVSW